MIFHMAHVCIRGYLILTPCALLALVCCQLMEHGNCQTYCGQMYKHDFHVARVYSEDQKMRRQTAAALRRVASVQCCTGTVDTE